MSRFKLQLALITLFVSAIILTGQRSARSNASTARSYKQPVIDLSYRAKAPSHKVIVYAHDTQIRDRILAEGGELIEDYGAFSLYRASTGVAEYVSLASSSGSAVRDDMNVLYLRAGAFDTTEGEPQAHNIAGEPEPSNEQLHLVQMVGPVKQEWYEELKSSVEIIAYVPNNAYLVRASPGRLGQVRALTSQGRSFIQWSGAFKPAYKIAPEISLESSQEILATVQLVTGPDTESDIHRIASLASGGMIGEPVSHMNYTNVRVKVEPRSLAEIARMNSVLWVEQWGVPELLDERQNLILTASYTDNQLGRPGYLAWLQSKRLAVTPDFLVDVSDSGIDQGSLDPEVIHKDFLSQGGLSRVVYARLLGQSVIEGSSHDTSGHGTLNAAIVGGYNTETVFPYVDNEGYNFGIGVHPFVKLGVSKIFNPEWTSPNVITMVDLMYRDGSRISSNSWGAYNNSYTTDSQLYDSMVRDARRNEPGNQEITILFASGNKGAGGNLSIPATAKNVITVGASENLRPTGIDGCGIAQDGADEIDAMIRFSSGGPCTDGRIKPEICAPGTHIQGARSQDRGYTGGGICGPMSFPMGQSLYTWSSGTSHSTPAVAGGAALIRQLFQQSTGTAPSPAMVKAFLTNSTTYVTGYMAGDNLPGNNQGWGLMNLARALDDAPRNMIDQTQVLGATGNATTVRGRVADSTKPFRVTLAWTDAPGTPSANPVVNDLDLQVDVGGKTYLGNRFSGGISVEGGTADKLNNIEGVWLPAGVSGEYTVRVVAANIAGDGVPGNGDSTDQDFALVVYNAQSIDSAPPGPVDPPPAVSLGYPVGGERLMVGNLIPITWTASDDKSIQSQRVEFSADGGATYDTIATLDGRARRFDWRIPFVPTTRGRIKVSALDGVNLPGSSASQANFEIVTGPPDTEAPRLTLVSPNSDTVIGGGTTTTIKWTEADNVGVIKRVIEMSTDSGRTWLPIVTLVAPSSGEQQSFNWQVPAALATTAGKVRVTLFDGAANSTAFISQGKFDVWPMPIITDANFLQRGSKWELEVFGRHFREKETDIIVDGRKLKKVRFNEKCDTEAGTCKKISSQDRKVDKFVPEGEFVNIEVRLPRTGQVSPAFNWKRKRPRQ